MEGGAAILEVEDDGVGMDKITRARLFRFTRVTPHVGPLDWVAHAPGVQTALERGRVEAQRPKLARRPGARRLVRSGAIGDD